MALNQLNVCQTKGREGKKTKVKFQSTLEKCQKTVTSAQSHLLQKRAKTLSTVETLCSACMGSFEEEANNSINSVCVLYEFRYFCEQVNFYNSWKSQSGFGEVEFGDYHK